MRDDKSRGNRLALVLTMCVVLLSNYPLSLGPVFWLDNHGSLPTTLYRPLGTAYAPLLSIEGTPAGDVLEAWVTLWLWCVSLPARRDA